MSLINEALKKAQHQRSGTPADAPPVPGGGSISRGSQGAPRGLLFLLLAGVAVVVMVSVVATVYFVNRSASTAVAERPPTVKLGPIIIPKPIATSNAASPSPVIIAPIILKPPAAAEPAPAATTAAATTPTDASTTGTKEAAPPAEAAPVPEGTLADRIGDYVDKLRVMGIRTSETGSKVLMNDRVYRVNDVVNRSLGLKLVKIDPDSLTFADANGATYVKNF